jgi:signal transduction histidine kinase
MTTNKTNAILKTVSNRIQEVIPVDRFYVAIFEQASDQVSFPLMKGNGVVEGFSMEPRPLRENTLPDLVIRQSKSVLVKDHFPLWLQENKSKYWDLENIPNSWLGVPLTVGAQVRGALIIESQNQNTSFTDNDLRFMETIARQTSAAIENARLYDQLDHKISNLKILNRVGQQLMKDIAKQESEILELIFRSATDLELDTRNLYITFYDPDPKIPDTPERIYGRLRFALAYDEGDRITIPDRPASNGLTEYVIRTRESFNPANVRQAYEEVAQDQIGKIPSSWLGVPMLAEGRVFGVIVLRNNTHERAYSKEDQEIVEILAGQAAISLLNLRYFEALQVETEQRIAVQKTAVMSMMAAEFAHKMNNIAGTIPVRVKMAKAGLDANNPGDSQVLAQLDKIESEAKNLLRAAQEIRETMEMDTVRVTEFVNLNELLENAARQARDTQINTDNDVAVTTDFDPDLPKIKLDRKSMVDTFTSIIKNGFEAIPDKGTITISTRLSSQPRNAAVEVQITDTGEGIPSSELPKLFDLFHTTKGDRGLGFGLWRDKVFLKNLGGDIDVMSEVGKGTSFILRIPVGPHG